MRKDWKKFGGGFFFLIDNQLPSQTVKIENPSDIEILTTEITSKYKSLVSGIQKPQYLRENNLATIVGNYYK